LTHSGRLTHEVVTRQPWIRRRSGKVRQLQTDVLTTEPRRQPRRQETSLANAHSRYFSCFCYFCRFSPADFLEDDSNAPAFFSMRSSNFLMTMITIYMYMYTRASDRRPN